MQDNLLTKIEELVSTFDAELRLLRHDKFKLDIIMKNADLRSVSTFLLCNSFFSMVIFSFSGIMIPNWKVVQGQLIEPA